MRARTSAERAAAAKHVAKSRVRVLVDMDGVLCDFDRGVNEWIARLHPEMPLIPLPERTVRVPWAPPPRRAPPRTVSPYPRRPRARALSCRFYASKHYKALYGDEAGARVSAIVTTESFIETLEPIPGCVEAVKARWRRRARPHGGCC